MPFRTQLDVTLFVTMRKVGVVHGSDGMRHWTTVQVCLQPCAASV